MDPESTAYRTCPAGSGIAGGPGDKMKTGVLLTFEYMEAE
jgi:hypothetical protein